MQGSSYVLSAPSLHPVVYEHCTADIAGLSYFCFDNSQTKNYI